MAKVLGWDVGGAWENLAGLGEEGGTGGASQMGTEESRIKAWEEGCGGLNW